MMCKGYFRSLQVIVSRRSTTHFLITVCHAQRKGKCHCRITSPLKAQNNLLVGLSKVTSKLAVRMLSGSHISIFVLNHDVKKKPQKIFKVELGQVSEDNSGMWSPVESPEEGDWWFKRPFPIPYI